MRPAVLALVLAGCSQLLGMRSTIGDRDHDGIPDDRDDCPDDYDPKQQDLDHDGIGDACGPCHSLTHDFDGDGRDDACDGCVGPGPTGVDSDHDGIDDGCEACVGGVDQTGMDLDHDGIGDGCDPCIASGIDRDHDGIDDACDPCLLGPPHDEDQDGIADACDDCPADPDAGQERAANGSLGVACDPDTLVPFGRRLFDPFAAPLDEVWQPDAVWVYHDDSVEPTGTDGELDSFYDLRGELVVRVSVQFDATATVSDGLGVSLVVPGGPLQLPLDCWVSGLGTVNGQLPTASDLLDTSGPIDLRAIRRVAADGSTIESCEADDAKGTKVIAQITSVTAGKLRIHLKQVGAGHGRFSWLDAVDHPVF